jgi:ABC-2 type transport system permease protein
VATTAAVFAALGAVAAQLTNGGGAARGVGVGVLGLAFMLRAAGDAMEIDTLAWLSPIGWFTRLRPFSGERWWVLGLSSAFALALGAIAFRLASRRDLGAGVLPVRAGPANAAAGLRSPTGLAWRLHRGSLLGWSIGLGVLAALYGTLADDVGEIFGGNPQLAEVLAELGGADRLTDTFFSFTAGVLALVAGAYSIRTALRLRSEEEGLRAEAVLATSTPRGQWMMSHLLFAFGGAAIMLVVAGLIMGATYGAAVDDVAGQMARVVGIAMIQLPAAWVLTAATAALYGLAPRATVVAWALLLGFLVVGQLGQILRFPQWLLNLSPFSHVATSTPGDISGVPIAVLLGVVFFLTGLGLAGFRRRDLTAA